MVGIAFFVGIVLVAVIRRVLAHRWSFGHSYVRTGLALALIGVGMWVLVYAVNGGAIPSTADAMRTAGRMTTERGAPAEELVDRHLPFLGNLVAWPAPLPGATVFGIPQILVLAGVAIACRLPKPPPDVTTMELVSGQIWWDAPEGGRDQLEVRLPGGTLRASEARLGVEMGSHGGVVVVLDGRVTLTNDLGEVEVVAGEGLAIGLDGPTGPPERMTLHELQSDPWIAPHLEDPVPRRRRFVIQGQGWPLPAMLAVILLGVLVVATYVAQVAVVPSPSMEPALTQGDRVVVAKAGGAPRVGDVVVFERPTAMRGEPVLLVKRIVAVGGQTVTVDGGRVVVDGRALQEPYLPSGTTTTAPCGPVDEVVVEPGDLYVLGDNRGDSTDSRCFGPVGSDTLVGTVVFGIAPPSGKP